jgi:hypothetical protein
MLKFYIISTVLSGIVSLISIKAISCRIKREGYVCKTKYSICEELTSYLYLLIPLFNILFALIALFKQEEAYQGALFKYEKRGVTAVNPDYLKLAQIGFDYILQTMIEGEKKHGADEWKNVSTSTHSCYMSIHGSKYCRDDKSEDHIAHAMTRCAIIKFLEGEKK